MELNGALSKPRLKVELAQTELLQGLLLIKAAGNPLLQ
jgi:hypothetical protein